MNGRPWSGATESARTSSRPQSPTAGTRPLPRAKTLATALPGRRYRITRVLFSLVRDRCRELGCGEGGEVTCLANEEGGVLLSMGDGSRAALSPDQALFVLVELLG